MSTYFYQLAPPCRFSEAAKDNMKRTIFALRRAGFINFWSQIILSCVSGVVLLFSVAFTPQARATGRDPPSTPTG